MDDNELSRMQYTNDARCVSLLVGPVYRQKGALAKLSIVYYDNATCPFGPDLSERDLLYAVLTPIQPPCKVIESVTLDSPLSGRIIFHLDFRNAPAGTYCLEFCGWGPLEHDPYFEEDFCTILNFDYCRFKITDGPWGPPAEMPVITCFGKSAGLAEVVAGCPANSPIETRKTAWGKSLPLRFVGHPGATLRGEVLVRANARLEGLSTEVEIPVGLTGTRTSVRVMEGEKLTDYPLLDLGAGESVRYAVEIVLPADAPAGRFGAELQLQTADGKFHVRVPIQICVEPAKKN